MNVINEFMDNKLQNNENKREELRKAIIKVIVFFDMFDYPLTPYEIWQNLRIECKLIDVMMALENLTHPVLHFEGRQSETKLNSQNGFYFLFGREKNIIERLARYNFTDRKFKKAMFITKIFKFIPWIKMIAIGNLIGAHNLRDGGDIDLFIITENKRIWITRFLCVSVIKILGLRPQENNSCDKICLSFYVSLSALNLEKLLLNQNDLYFIYWLAGLMPIYDAENTYEKFIQSNKWIKKYLPNWQLILSRQKVKTEAELRGAPRSSASVFFVFLEQQFKKLQLKLLPKKLKDLMNCDSRVVINDQMIKLHSNDRREEYMRKMSNF